MKHVRTLILGGGMSGLSCAYHLKSDYEVWEKSDEPGGLSRSIKQDGYVFDHTGHLLHLRDPYTLELIPRLLGDNLVKNERNAWIFSHHTYTRYPFQANTYGLPKKVVKECLEGLIKAQLRGGAGTSKGVILSDSEGSRRGRPRQDSSPSAQNDSRVETLRSWVRKSFGEGFGKNFFYPYNEKLWTVSPDVLTSEWMGPFVPKPPVAEIVEGAFTDRTHQYGYNATFLYPREGGIQALAYKFAEPLGDNVRLRQEVKSIDLEGKVVTSSSGEIVTYDHLVTSLPLVRFLGMIKNLPADVKATAAKLSWTSVYNLNLGIKGRVISDKHWIYFPEKKYRFYRVGFPMNFSDKMTPPGCSSMYIELAHKPGKSPDAKKTYQECLKGLYDCGLLTKKDKIATQLVLPIPIAYVIYDKHRTPATKTLLSYLASQNVYSIGRFGGWKYSYMEEAILEGKSAAEKIDGA